MTKFKCTTLCKTSGFKLILYEEESENDSLRMRQIEIFFKKPVCSLFQLSNVRLTRQTLFPVDTIPKFHTILMRLWEIQFLDKMKE